MVQKINRDSIQIITQAGQSATTTTVMTTTVRPIHEIAAEIKETWTNVRFCAAPYLRAMGRLSHIEDMYGYDSAKSIIIHFLSNASTWRGEDAKRIKSELKELIK